MKEKKKWIVMIIVVVVLLLLDQSLKLYAIHHTEGQIILTGLNIVYEESNKGAFGVGQNSIMTYTISTIIVLGVVLKFFSNQIEQINLGMVIGISCILAGGISNLIDKILHGFVINDIQLGGLPAVNLSFFWIVLGWISLAAIFAFHTWKEMRKKDA